MQYLALGSQSSENKQPLPDSLCENFTSFNSTPPPPTCSFATVTMCWAMNKISSVILNQSIVILVYTCISWMFVSCGSVLKRLMKPGLTDVISIKSLNSKTWRSHTGAPTPNLQVFCFLFFWLEENVWVFVRRQEGRKGRNFKVTLTPTPLPSNTCKGAQVKSSRWILAAQSLWGFNEVGDLY